MAQEHPQGTLFNINIPSLQQGPVKGIRVVPQNVSAYIEKFDRRWENYEGVEDGFVRPYGFLNVHREIYQRNEKWVWAWMPDAQAEDVDASAPLSAVLASIEFINEDMLNAEQSQSWQTWQLVLVMSQPTDHPCFRGQGV